MHGAQAIERVISHHRGNRDYDICLIDWKMHDIDGIEVTRRIRAEVGYDVPIVMISAYDYMEIEEEARAAGVDGFLPKPLYRTAVYEEISRELKERLLVQLINGRNYTKKLIKISEFSTPGKTQLRSNPLTFQNALYYNFSCSM